MLKYRRSFECFNERKRPAAAASGHAIDAQLEVRREAACVLDEVACEEERVRLPIGVLAEYEVTPACTTRKHGYRTYPFAVVEGEHHSFNRVWANTAWSAPEAGLVTRFVCREAGPILV
jgi:hypothetical protein